MLVTAGLIDSHEWLLLLLSSWTWGFIFKLVGHHIRSLHLYWMNGIWNVVFGHALLETAVSSDHIRVVNFMSSLIKSVVDLLQSVNVRLLSVLIEITVIKLIFIIMYLFLWLLFRLSDLVQNLSNLCWGTLVTEIGTLAGRNFVRVNTFTTSLTFGILGARLHDDRWYVGSSTIRTSPWFLITLWTTHLL